MFQGSKLIKDVLLTLVAIFVIPSNLLCKLDCQRLIPQSYLQLEIQATKKVALLKEGMGLKVKFDLIMSIHHHKRREERESKIATIILLNTV